MEDGDANEIMRYVHEQFDFVFSSHCLEHMRDPRKALLQWWALVRPGGHLFFIVPDEDLYEQGVFPSRFNPDHKATFTISKESSWSPVSVNVRELALGLPDALLVSLILQDHGYDRSLLRGSRSGPGRSVGGLLHRACIFLRRRGPGRARLLESVVARLTGDRPDRVSGRERADPVHREEGVLRRALNPPGLSEWAPDRGMY